MNKSIDYYSEVDNFYVECFSHKRGIDLSYGFDVEDLAEHLMYSDQLCKEVVTKVFCFDKFKEFIYPRCVEYNNKILMPFYGSEVLPNIEDLSAQSDYYYDEPSVGEEFELVVKPGLNEDSYSKKRFSFPSWLAYDNWEEHINKVIEAIEAEALNRKKMLEKQEDEEYKTYLRLRTKYGKLDIK